MMIPDLRQMSYFVEIADQRSFTRAARNLHVAQQALSQQLQVMEDGLGVRLLDRSPRRVAPTPAGTVFLQEARRVLAAADRAVDRTRAAARGEVGTLRLGYTLVSAHETVPALLDAAQARYQEFTVAHREVFGADLNGLLLERRADIGIAPSAPLPEGLVARPVRREPLVLAVGRDHPLAARDTVTVGELRDATFACWPREVSPGFHDAVVGACRDAGFEPELNEHASGSLVWRTLGEGRDVALTVRGAQPDGHIVLRELAEPRPSMTIDLVTNTAADSPLIENFTALAHDVATERGWLATPG